MPRTEFNSEHEVIIPNLENMDFGQAVLWGTDWTVETILNQLQRGNIELNPRFQRRDAWKKRDKSRFVESVILGLPIPQVVLAESKNVRGRYIILDGKQRLLSLMQFYGIGEGVNNNFALSGLDVRGDLIRKKYRDLANDVILRDDLNAFLTHTIRTTVIRNWPSLRFLHVVFERLNTGSLKLSPQELRQAVVPGPFTDLADDTTIKFEVLWSLLGNEAPDPRMRDVELLVRATSFKLRLEMYGGRMKEFLDQSCSYFNENWERERERVEAAFLSFRAAVDVLLSIFGHDGIARKLGSQLFNRSIFDALIYYAMDVEIRTRMLEERDAVSEAYSSVVSLQAFQEAVDSDTAGIPHTFTRLRIWGEQLSAAIGQNVAVPRIEQNEADLLRFVR